MFSILLPYSLLIKLMAIVTVVAWLLISERNPSHLMVFHSTWFYVNQRSCSIQRLFCYQFYNIIFRMCCHCISCDNLNRITLLTKLKAAFWLKSSFKSIKWPIRPHQWCYKIQLHVVNERSPFFLIFPDGDSYEFFANTTSPKKFRWAINIHLW